MKEIANAGFLLGLLFDSEGGVICSSNISVIPLDYMQLYSKRKLFKDTNVSASYSTYIFLLFYISPL
jgi:hypothetical protein